MSKMYLVKPDGIDAEWNATNYGENEYTQLSMKMIMPTEKSSETYGIFQELLFRLGWRANDTDICPMNMEQCHSLKVCKRCLLLLKKDKVIQRMIVPAIPRTPKRATKITAPATKIQRSSLPFHANDFTFNENIGTSDTSKNENRIATTIVPAINPMLSIGTAELNAYPIDAQKRA